MSDRGPNQDLMPIAGDPDTEDPTYRDAAYLGTSEDDEEEVRDLGFIVDDHDDRRISLTDGWQRLDDLDTDEPLETNRSGPIPHETSLRERGVPEDSFATDYHVSHADAEAQEEDFVQTSMLNADPGMNDGDDDFTSEHAGRPWRERSPRTSWDTSRGWRPAWGPASHKTWEAAASRSATTP